MHTYIYAHRNEAKRMPSFIIIVIVVVIVDVVIVVIIMYVASLIKNSCVRIVLYASVLPSLHMHAICIQEPSSIK